MATKKKAAPKKAVRKVVKKAPAKKTVKKVTKKRSYNRKPKTVEAEAINTGADQAPQLDKAQAGDDQMDSIGSFGEFLSKMLDVEEGANQAEPGNESPLELLRQIQVIDLRDVSVKDRFQILVLLASEGYITSTVESLIENLDNLRVGLEAEALVLQHENKLVRPAYWPEIEAGDYQAISRPSVSSSKISIGFSLPEPAYPNTTRIGDAFYVRVS